MRSEDPMDPCEGADGADAMDDGIDWKELQSFFFEHLREQLTAMDGLLAKSDYATLARLGHSLKGSGGGVRLPHFTDLGSTLEIAAKASDPEESWNACRALRDAYLVHHPEDAAYVGGLFASAPPRRAAA